jgi:hypothetical protein
MHIEVHQGINIKKKGILKAEVNLRLKRRKSFNVIEYKHLRLLPF